jgi:hypothetical protein
VLDPDLPPLLERDIALHQVLQRMPIALFSTRLASTRVPQTIPTG